MDDPDIYPWIWLIGAAVLGAGEIATTGFFLLPFALGSLIASVLAFAGFDLVWQLGGFALVSTVTFALFRPIARRLDAESPSEGIGSRRLIGQPALVIEDIFPGDSGMVRVQREEWRAETHDGRALPAGSRAVVREVQGTRVIVTLDTGPAAGGPPNA